MKQQALDGYRTAQLKNIACRLPLPVASTAYTQGRPVYCAAGNGREHSVTSHAGIACLSRHTSAVRLPQKDKQTSNTLLSMCCCCRACHCLAHSPLHRPPPLQPPLPAVLAWHPAQQPTHLSDARRQQRAQLRWPPGRVQPPTHLQQQGTNNSSQAPLTWHA